jgi:hypothetical protein
MSSDARLAFPSSSANNAGQAATFGAVLRFGSMREVILPVGA